MPNQLIFYFLDSYYLKKEDVKVETPQEKLKLGIEGVFNLGLIVGVIGAVLISGFWKPHISFEVYSGVHLELQNLTRDILLLILTFIFSFFISLYHFGIEQGIFQESTVCGVKNFSENVSKEELLNQLSEKTISCKDVTFRILGLSLTTINIVISILFIITLAKIFTKYEKN